MTDSNFTEEQENLICEKIDAWYLIWKNRLVDYKDRTHKLGYAKEQLKIMICGEKIKEL